MTERMKAYHSEWSHEDLMKARSGIVVDDGEAWGWRYEYSHEDSFGKYDVWYRAPNPLEPKAEKTLRDWFAGQWVAAGHHANITPRDAAEQAYEFADAMLEARDQ